MTIMMTKMVMMELMMQEWEALTGQLVTDVRADATEMKDALPKWIDEERASSVLSLKVGYGYGGILSSITFWSPLLSSGSARMDNIDLGVSLCPSVALQFSCNNFP